MVKPCGKIVGDEQVALSQVIHIVQNKQSSFVLEDVAQRGRAAGLIGYGAKITAVGFGPAVDQANWVIMADISPQHAISKLIAHLMGQINDKAGFAYPPMPTTAKRWLEPVAMAVLSCKSNASG